MLLHIFFAHENIKKLPSKVTYLWQFDFFLSAVPTTQNSLRIENSYYKYGSRYLCLLFCEQIVCVCPNVKIGMEERFPFLLRLLE